MYELEFYETRRGTMPVKEYLDVLKEKADKDKRSKRLLKQIYYAFELIQESGTLTGMPHVKKMGDKLYELRVSKERVFFFQKSGGTITLLHHFTKKSKKTPDKELAKARRYMKDWQKR